MKSTFIDIHNHGAWDIDDGMPCREDAIKSLVQAQSDEISTIIVTPHFVPATHTRADVEAMDQRVIEFKDLAKAYDIEVYAGSEVFLNSSYLDMIDEHLFNTLAQSDYVLVEFDVRRELSHDESEVEDKLYELKVRGYIPVIAHVERYFHRKIDIDRVKQWVKLGCAIQINRTSLLGMQGDVCEDNAKALIEQGCAHIIASDTHSCSGSRICKMSDAYSYIKKKYGESNANILCIENPNKIIANEAMTQINIPQRSFMQKLWKRS